MSIPPAGSSTPTENQRPIFIYGTLCARPLLAWVLTGDATQIDAVSRIIFRAHAEDVARYSLRGCDYPAAIREPGSTLRGYLLHPETTSQRRKLDDFEGEVYHVESVRVTILAEGNGKGQGKVDADIYLWKGDKSKLSGELWDLEWFIKERLEDWIDLFEGMEMTGDDASPRNDGFHVSI